MKKSKLSKIVKDTGKGTARAGLTLGSAAALYITCKFMPEIKEAVNNAPIEKIDALKAIYDSTIACAGFYTYGLVNNSIKAGKNFYNAGKAIVK